MSELENAIVRSQPASPGKDGWASLAKRCLDYGIGYTVFSSTPHPVEIARIVRDYLEDDDNTLVLKYMDVLTDNNLVCAEQSFNKDNKGVDQLIQFMSDLDNKLRPVLLEKLEECAADDSELIQKGFQKQGWRPPLHTEYVLWLADGCLILLQEDLRYLIWSDDGLEDPFKRFEWNCSGKPSPFNRFSAELRKNGKPVWRITNVLTLSAVFQNLEEASYN